MATPAGGLFIGVDVIGAGAVSASMLATDRAVQAGVQRQVYLHGELLRSTVRAKASGRPGPRVQTGDYRRGIAVSHGHAPARTGAGQVPASTVRSNSPQAWRLERGFVGADVLGRVYNQPAYEHWGPAIDVVEPKLHAAIDKVWADADAAGSVAARGALTSLIRRGL